MPGGGGGIGDLCKRKLSFLLKGWMETGDFRLREVWGCGGCAGFGIERVWRVDEVERVSG